MIKFTSIKHLICFAFLFFAGITFAQVSQSDSTITDNSADSLDNTFNIPVFNATGGDIDSYLGGQGTAWLLQSCGGLCS